MKQMIMQQSVTLTTVGSAGSAVATAQVTRMHGFLLDVFLNYHASAPNTTDVTISNTLEGDNLLVVSNNEVDGRYAPRQAVHDAAAAAISGAADLHPLNQALTIAVAGCDALTGALVATVRWLEIS